MQRLRVSRLDVAMTCLSAAIEAFLLGRWVNKRWFCG